MKWNLEHILKKENFDSLYREIESEIEKLKEQVEKLDPKMSQEKFKEYLVFNEKLGVKLARLNYLPFLMESVNQKDQEARLLKSRAEKLSLEVSEIGVKMEMWIKGKREPILDEENAKRLFGTISDLEYPLWRSRESAKYTLNESEEQIIEHKDVNGVGVLSEVREMIETDFEYELKIGKRTKKIKTQAELMALAYSPKAAIRKAVYKALLKKQKENIDKFFVIYQGIVKDWGYEAKLRGYKSPISVRNWGNHIPDEAIEKLLESCSKNVDIFQKYFKWKAKRLGVKKIRREDIYAPIKSKEVKIDFEEARKLVIESFREFSPIFAEAAEKILNDGHVDVKPNKNKRGGAFCATVAPEISPYVMLNFTGKSRDISTLAHELGHGVHSVLANKHWPSSQQANLPLAETASTLGELILFEKMMAKEKDKEIKRSWLSDKIADAYATICRQNYFVKFEIEAHEAIEKGVTAEELSKLYLQSLKEQFGRSITIDPLFRYEWSYISHIFESPFYCYAYNFGELLSYSLWANYKKDPKKWVKVIETILEAGGSQSPQKILDDAKMEICAVDFWQKAFSVVDEWMDELKSL